MCRNQHNGKGERNGLKADPMPKSAQGSKGAVRDELAKIAGVGHDTKQKAERIIFLPALFMLILHNILCIFWTAILYIVFLNFRKFF